jgi:hypothetical protein
MTTKLINLLCYRICFWTAASNGGIQYVRIAYVVEKKKLGIYARYETSFDGINLQFQHAVWNGD